MTSQEIMAKYSFFHPEKSETESLMCFGFECGKGWYNLIDELCQKIKDTNPPEDFEIIQVKEKFGTLRVYTNYSTKEIEELITEAENKSAVTCEVCGDVGKETGDYWIRTLCEKCVK